MSRPLNRSTLLTLHGGPDRPPAGSNSRPRCARASRLGPRVRLVRPSMWPPNGRARRVLMTVRLTPWGVVESDLVAAPVTRRDAAVLRRFATRRHGARFWLALWTFAVAVEIGVLVPVLFPDGKVESLDVAFRL